MLLTETTLASCHSRTGGPARRRRVTINPRAMLRNMLNDDFAATLSQWVVTHGPLRTWYLSLCYTKNVEQPKWAKAHFFIAVRERMTGTRETIAAKITEIAQRVGEPEGLEIVDVEVLGGGKARLVRIYIDKPAGVSHADCEFISQQVGTILDVEDVVPGERYTLEVSSPGLERKLIKATDFEKFVGRKAKVVLREPVENQRHWEGKLAGISEGMVALEASTGKLVHFPFAQVQKANLKFEW